MSALNQVGKSEVMFRSPGLSIAAILAEFLYTVPQFFRHERRVDTSVYLAYESEVAVVDRIFE